MGGRNQMAVDINRHLNRVVAHLLADVAQSPSAKWSKLPRAALESLALEAYRAEVLTTAELQQLLGYDTPYALDGFLKEHGVHLDYSADELEREAENSRGLAHRRKSEIDRTIVSALPDDRRFGYVPH